MAQHFPTRALVVAGLLALLSFAAPLQKKKPSLIERSLAEAFPDCEVERVTCSIDAAQAKRIGKLSSQRAFGKKTTFAYVARKDGKVVGTAFFDSHKVRTKRETLMVLVAPDGSVLGVQTIVFQEPPEYVAQDKFYESLMGREQGRDLQLGRGLDGTTGATLTCRAVADASRRVLALHQVMGKKVGRVPVETTPPAKPKPVTPKPVTPKPKK